MDVAGALLKKADKLANNRKLQRCLTNGVRDRQSGYASIVEDICDVFEGESIFPDTPDTDKKKQLMML